MTSLQASGHGPKGVTGRASTRDCPVPGTFSTRGSPTSRVRSSLARARQRRGSRVVQLIISQETV